MRFAERAAGGGKLQKAAQQTTVLLGFLVLAMLVSGCNGLPKTAATPSPSTQPSPRDYMAPYVIGDTTPGFSVSQYQFDDTAQTFSKSTYLLNPSFGQQGAQIYLSGATNSATGGMLSLELEFSNSGQGNTKTYNPPQPGSWAIELPNQAGGLVQMNGQPVEPIVAATSCPDYKTSQTYQFVTIPASMLIGGAVPQPYTWDPTQETVYGSVDITGSGSKITFSNIHQYAMPAAPGGPPVPPTTAAVSPQTGTCSAGYYGNTTVVPGDLTVTNPGPNSDAPPVALVGIGPTGLLIESNAANGEIADVPFYQNLLGAGTGAIGLPKPSSAIATSSLVSAQYLGFFYGSGDGNNDWSSYIASFGFNTLPASCNSVAAPSSTLIYGGEFPGNNPATTANCDIAVDLGAQDPQNAGLYPAATIHMGQFFKGNQLVTNYTVPAVAIAGQLGSKNAIFVLGVDTTGIPNQAWGIYLLQSN
ncbi:MAG TPA: hypothetical protein VKB38_10695 [Terracidiphilus sp.]|nr:hypothetical protein [Terracidiphilus sp.]